MPVEDDMSVTGVVIADDGGSKDSLGWSLTLIPTSSDWISHAV